MSLARVVVLAGLAACASPSSSQWRAAEALWRSHDPGAWAAWRALDGSGDEGRAARRRLDEADRRFRRGVELLGTGQPGAREELAAGFTLAPMNPVHYLPLARAYRDRDAPERAADFYRKFLAYAPTGPESAAARAELQALDLVDPFAPFEPTPAPSLWWVAAASLGAAVAMALAAWLWSRRRGAGRTLAELAEESPELQPAIAFLVGCLRHELIKHRLLAIGDAVRALLAGEPASNERRLLWTRLYGGEPLSVAWAGHLSSFMRALGPRFDLQRHDPVFRDAGRALAEIAALEAPLAAGDAAAVERLGRAHSRIVELDLALAALLGRLMRTTIDRALVDGVVGEWARLGADVDIEVGPLPSDVAVEIYRVDLELVLRNLVRNAVAAALRGPAPRRVAVDVLVELEATGEEVVRLRVRDTNPDPLPPPPSNVAPQPARGLGLVRTALERSDASLESVAAEAPYRKAVAVRLFRSMTAAVEAA